MSPESLPVLVPSPFHDKQNTRPQKRTGVSQIQLKDLVPNHCGAEETQHLANRICDRRATAAGEKKTDRARIRRDILHHQRPGIAAVEEFASSVCHNDLAGECFGEGGASRALVIIGDADRRVQTRDRTSAQPSRATALFDCLIKGGANGGGGDGADLKNRAIGSHLAAGDLRDVAIDVAVRQRTFFHQRRHLLCARGGPIDVN